MNKCYFGDCRDSMREMISQGVKVQMAVTSPPYYGLRDYGVDGQCAGVEGIGCGGQQSSALDASDRN